MASRSSESVSFERRDEENQLLREENARLRRVLAAHGIPVPQFTPDHALRVKTIAPAAVENKEERAQKRIALFRSLFRGREDVYARRWESPDGRSGYSPASERDWKAINRSMPEDRKKVDQKTRKFYPLTDTVIENHLLGKETIGVYPLLADETCRFLAVDFDKKTWQKDATAFLAVCCELKVPAALERSRSGNGGHVWIFFEREIG